jgi:hypothetical protein
MLIKWVDGVCVIDNKSFSECVHLVLRNLKLVYSNTVLQSYMLAGHN